MKPGVVGTVVVILAGGAVGGALFLRDRSKLDKANKLKQDGLSKLASGDLSGAAAALSEAREAAAQVTAVTGMGGQALDVQEAARRADRLRRALAEVDARPLEALRVLDGAEAPPKGSEPALAKARAHLLLEGALRFEQRGAVDQAVTLFTAAAQATKAAGSDRAAEAEKGRRRMVLVTRLQGAERAIRGKGVEQAARMAREARKALEGPESPFEDAERVAALKRRLDVILAEVKSGQLLERYAEQLRRLGQRARTSALGKLLSEVEALKPPALAGGHPRAAAHTKRLETLKERHAWLTRAAKAFAGMVFLKRTGKGALFIDKTEVTNAAFLKFVEAKGYTQPDPKLWSREAITRLKRNQYKDRTRKPGPRYWKGSKPPEGTERHPVTGISYHEAIAYARWKQKRLPTLAEWKAACANEPYPWGGGWSAERANITGRGGKLRPVGSHPRGAARNGALDLIGNAMEMVSGGENKYFGVGGYYAGLPEEAKVDKRITIPESLRNKAVGFRCVKELIWEP